MTNRNHIERILKLNGVSPTAKDEEIRSILLSARFNKDEVDTALVILRENLKTNENRVDGLHKVFRTDEALNAAEIYSLLGVDVNLDSKVKVKAGRDARSFSTLNQTILFFVAIILGFVGILLYMYVAHIGLFHPSSAFAFTIFQ